MAKPEKAMTTTETETSEPAASHVKGRGPRSLVFRDSRTICLNVQPSDAFTPIRRIGGAAGWYYANWLWRLRGALDLLVGGIGLRSGRRDPDNIEVGDSIDCWRVEEFEPDRRLLLVLEMKHPGYGTLEFEVTGDGDSSTIRQTATYDTGGFWGCLYWYLSYPLHEVLFRGMLRNIGAAGLACAGRQEIHGSSS
ncbi:MAG: DUF2867 domain-containing protein [Acidobacteria bacterium]|nr:DUF2867 domain-containing protein [Acidobacteriota bacterium]